MEIGEGSALNTILQSFKGLYTQITAAAIALLFGILLGKLIGKLVLRFLHELEVNRLVKQLTRTSFPLEEFISSGLTYLTYFAFIILSLETLGLNPQVFNLIAAGIIAVVVISVLLAVKDIIPNVIAGIFIHLSNHIREGDSITVKDITGKVEQVGMVETKLETRAGDTIYVPNSLLTKSIVARKRKRTERKK